MNSKYSNVLTIALIAGIVIILIGVCVAGVFMMRNNKLNQEEADAVEQYQKNVKKNNEEVENKENTQTGEIVQPELNGESIAPILTTTNTIADSGSNTNGDTKKTATYKGFPMVGTIEIPAINLKSPVLKEASKKSMDIAVGIYDGPGLNQVGNTTIAGHNYRDGRFFANNKKLVEGDKIYITDEINRKIVYSIYKIYITTPEDSSYLDRDTEGRREISLTTCTDDTQSRLIIWAKEQ